MDQGRLVAEGSVEDWQRTLRRVQIVFDGTHPPANFVIPGAIRTRTTGPVVTALIRIENESQLDPVRQISGSRVLIFTLSLEEIFVEFFDCSIS